MGTFFDQFPRITYDMGKNGRRHFDLITDIFFRFKFIDRIKRLKVAYQSYRIEPGDTPNIVADKLYGDSEADWIILFLNDIVDPDSDWYMDQPTFTKFINAKYGSLSAALNTVHHYELKTSTRIVGYRNARPLFTNTVSQIDGTDIQDTTFDAVHPELPYSAYNSIAERTVEFSVNDAGQQIEIVSEKSSVNCFDYEETLNESRRFIKVLPAAAFAQVKSEFQQLVSEYNPARRLNFRKVSV